MTTVTHQVSIRAVDWPLYSCDDHLDMWALPLDLWTSRLPAADRERAPRVVDRNGVPTWVVGDSVLGISGLPTSGAHGALGAGRLHRRLAARPNPTCASSTWIATACTCR